MLALQQNRSTAYAPPSSHNKAHTTLYDLIVAVYEVIGPDEEELVGTVVMQLLEDYHARLEGDSWNSAIPVKGGHLYLYRRAEA